MKKLFLLLVLFTMPAFAQYTTMYTAKGTVTTAWTAFTKGGNTRIVSFQVSNDNAYSSTDSLYVAFSSDTTYERREVLAPGETSLYTPVSLTTFRLRAGSGTVAYRIRYH